MTIILKNSSELAESAELIGELLTPVPESLQYDAFHKISSSVDQTAVDEEERLFVEKNASSKMVREKPQPEIEPARAPVQFTGVEDLDDVVFTGDKLEKLLANLCRQSGFSSAVVADEKGLPIGGVNTPVAIDILAAFSSVLGDVIDKVPYFLQQYEAGNISIDINYIEKAVVQKFLIEEDVFYLLIICSQDIDERAYVELFSDQITKVLKR